MTPLTGLTPSQQGTIRQHLRNMRGSRKLMPISVEKLSMIAYQ